MEIVNLNKSKLNELMEWLTRQILIFDISWTSWQLGYDINRQLTDDNNLWKKKKQSQERMPWCWWLKTFDCWNADTAFSGITKFFRNNKPKDHSKWKKYESLWDPAEEMSSYQTKAKDTLFILSQARKSGSGVLTPSSSLRRHAMHSCCRPLDAKNNLETFDRPDRS